MRLSAVSLSLAVLAAAQAASAQAASAQAAGAQAVTAPPAAAASDATCLLDMVALSNSTEPDAQKAGQEGAVFFVGRISARDPGFEFARLKAMAATMNAQTAQADLQQKCGPMLQTYMEKLDAALGAPPSPAAPATPPAAR